MKNKANQSQKCSSDHVIHLSQLNTEFCYVLLSVDCEKSLWILMAAGDKEEKEFEMPAYRLTQNV